MKKIKDLYKLFLQSDGVSTDTRQNVQNKVFFALSGDNFDGNRFAEDALIKGALISVIDNPKYRYSDKYFVVNDVLEALQLLAKHHRNESDVTVMAITGSNGKTTTKELISSVLTKSNNIISTSGNLNNHIGVPLTLLRIIETTEIAIIEMGANHIGEIDSLCEIAMPEIGLITNIGKAHLEGFGSYQGVITAKNELFNYIQSHYGHLIVNVDDPLITELAGKTIKTTYGTNNADVEGEIVNTHPHLQVKWGYDNLIIHCHSQLYGKYNYYNILAAVATGYYFNIDSELINEAISNYIPENNRSQQLKTKSNSIILDAYNANPFSMNEAIISFAECDYHSPWLLLGDMFELGKYSEEEHNKIVELLIKNGFENVILIGHEFSKTTGHNFKIFNDVSDARLSIIENPIVEADILIKGSRGMKMEDLLIVL